MDKFGKWKNVKTVTQAKALIDDGVLLKWSELRILQKRLSEVDQGKTISHFLKKICEKHDDRFQLEIYVESLLLWITYSLKDENLKVLTDQLFAEPNGVEGCLKLVELALTMEITDSEHQDEVYAAAVIMVCEIGRAIVDQPKAGGPRPDHSDRILAAITTYLMSVSNHNHYAIRLSLLHYFGIMARENRNRVDFEKVLDRFGYTVLDFLFSLLFKKKTEGLALQFLLENLPLILEAEPTSQRIIHEIFKYHLLKKPDRFSLFLLTLGDHLSEGEHTERARKTFLQHLGALLKIVAKINHKGLTNDILSCIYRIRDPFLSELTAQIKAEPLLADYWEFAQTLYENENRQNVDPLNYLRSHKRGRHPSFHAFKRIELVQQVAQLSSLRQHHHHAKAS
ncbi:MAG: hypothetical protein HYW48_05845 [Deltaproteobacteria bacterium]|nr:hypothetical protein [Deltaproteobacteria bacterium]